MSRWVLFAWALLLPTLSWAQTSYDWCVDSTGTVNDWSSCPTPWNCDSTALSIADAVAAARASPDSSPGIRPVNHAICVRTPGIHTEDVSIDNSDGQLGEQVEIHFDGTSLNLCPATNVSTYFELEGNGFVQGGHDFVLSGLGVQQSACAGAPRALVHVSDSDLTIESSRVLGGLGPLIESAQPDPAIVIRLRHSRVEGAVGPVFSGTGSLALDSSEISRVATGSQPLLQTEGFSSILDIYDSAVFGNISDGAPLLASGGRLFIYSSVLSGNVVLGSEPLIHTNLVDGVRSARVGLDSTVVSRNVLLADGTATVAPVEFVPIISAGAEDFCLPGGSDQRGYADRLLPTWSGTASTAPLLAVDGLQILPRASISLLKSFIVENAMGAGAPIVSIVGAVDDIEMILVHSTVSQPGAPLFEGLGTGTGATFVSARNLFVTPPEVTLGPAWSRVEAALDESSAGVITWTDELSGHEGIVGPYVDGFPWGGEGQFLEPSTVRGLPDCFRATLLCPELANDCSQGGFAFCALDAAAEYLPAAATLAAMSVPWPWNGEFDLRSVSGPEGAVAGATGWWCGQHLFPWDRFIFGTKERGDGDPWTTLFDCDNDDETVTPVLPAEDGIETEDCRRLEDGCYECPDGTEVSDDDDSTELDDDDSTQTTDDDDSSGAEDPVPEPGTTRFEVSGCSTSGCGIGYHCDEGVIVALIPALALGWRIRRRISNA